MRRGVHPETSCVCSCPTSCRASRACRAGHQQQQGISTLFPARHGFPYVGRMSGMSGAPDFMGHHAGRMEGHGPDAARGRHGETRAAPDGLSLDGWPFRASTPGLRPPYGAGAAAWIRRGVHPETSCVCSCPTSCRASRACRAGHQQQQGISTLFPARHGFPYVGRMSGMSGAPDFMGHHAGRMEGHGPDAARGRHGETRAAPDGLSLGG